MTDRMSGAPSFGADYLDSMFDLQLRRRDPAEVWITGAGEHMLISEMTGQHARNALRLIKRMAARGRVWRMNAEGKLVHDRLRPSPEQIERWSFTPWYNAANFCPPIDRPGYYLMRHWRERHHHLAPQFVWWGSGIWFPRRGALCSMNPKRLPHYEWRGLDGMFGY
jgi:hypothetical protein